MDSEHRVIKTRELIKHTRHEIFATARGASVGLEHGRSIAKAFVARRTAAQVVAFQLDQIESFQEHAAVVAAMAQPVTRYAVVVAGDARR